MTVMYLPKDQWSPRFDATFFSIKIESAEKLDAPPETSKVGIGGKTKMPAVYYTMSVFCEHRRISFKRRYSNFKWLYAQIKAAPPPPPPVLVEDDFRPLERPLLMPPGTCLFQPQDDEFVQKRKEQLGDFIDELLSRPGYAAHPAVRLFFELDRVGSTSSE